MFYALGRLSLDPFVPWVASSLSCFVRGPFRGGVFLSLGHFELGFPDGSFCVHFVCIFDHLEVYGCQDLVTYLVE